MCAMEIPRCSAPSRSATRTSWWPVRTARRPQVSDESRSRVKEVQAASVLTSLNREPIGNEVGEEVLPTVRWGQYSLLTLIDSKGAISNESIPLRQPQGRIPASLEQEL